ncbi:adenosylcobalamin-dependent ribonucleoside-diphosphate reductase [Nitrospira calida]|jgi:ribonucleoside-diphosphate reductase alpha chain
MVQLSDNALRVLQARYLRRDATGQVLETPEDMFARVADAIAQAEVAFGHPDRVSYWRDEFYQLMTSLTFLPNSPTLMNAPGGQLSACFVLPVEDSIEAIFRAITEMALVQRSGGGTGFSFSRLRPKGDFVASTGGEASGPVSFMKIFDCATEHIRRGGRRRGANMGILRVDHPDILEFIAAKLDGVSLQNFNLSVGVTDAFMEAVCQGTSYDLVHPKTGRTGKQLRAMEVFEAITDAAWRTGDPGLLFLDAINRANPTPHLGAIEATNPCGEVPLLPYESCNLGSLNVALLISERNGRPVVDWERLRTSVRLVVRFLDNVIEVNHYPTPETSRMAQGNRKIGLGVMGLADLLIRLGLSYDSDQAIELAEQLMRTIAEEARVASQALAEERGVFPNWSGSIYERQGLRLRNATCTAIAPTGTISIIAGTSASIEPLFALAYRRRHTLGGEGLVEVKKKLLLDYCTWHGLNTEKVIAEVQKRGRLAGVPGLPDEATRLFVTALDVPVERHLQIQAAFQCHVDNSVSKTINLPQEAVPAEVARAYRRAWELGLKGVTIYRYGSKDSQVFELGIGEEAFQYDHASTCDRQECRL